VAGGGAEAEDAAALETHLWEATGGRPGSDVHPAVALEAADPDDKDLLESYSRLERIKINSVIESYFFCYSHHSII
jgi:hypothetical protein